MLFLFIVPLFLDFSFAKCPDGTTPVPSSFGSKWPCLLFDSSEQGFLIAESTCINNGGHLVSVQNGFVNAFIAQSAQLAFGSTDLGKKFWIGVSNLSRNGWENIDDGSQTTFFDWASEEPASSTSQNGCVSMDMNGLWYNSNCYGSSTTCRNGLYWNGQCVCDEYYQGTYCEVPICVNGGLVNTADKTCQCPSGYAGRNCQFDYCFTPVNTTFSNDGKAFIVVIETTPQNQAAVQKFGADLTTMLNNVTSATSSNWFSQYILVTFDSNGVISKGSATNVNDFVNLYNTNTGTLSNNNNCSLPIFAAIATVATSDLPSQSIMYLVTTGGSSSDDTTNSIYTAFNNAANTDVMINYVLIVSDSCSNEVTTGSSMYISNLAAATGGNTYLIDAGEISNFAGAHLPTLYNGSLLGTPSLTNQSHQCTGTVFYFPIDRDVQTVYLYIYAEFGEPSIVSPDGSTMVPKSFYADKNLFFYSFPSAGQGIYALSISDSGICMVQVRIQGGFEIYPSFITVPSINGSVASNLDNSSPVPNIGQNLLVIHMPDERVEVQYAQFWTTRSALGEIQYVQLYRRFNCFYEWYSDPFTCDEDGYFITVFGIGSRGAPWARQFYTKCSGYNGSTVTQSQYQDTTTFILNALNQFNIGYQKGIQVGIVTTYGDDEGFAPLLSNFNGIADYNALNYTLTYGYPQNASSSGTGQSALTQALKLVESPQFKRDRYRNTIQNHLIVYITTTSTPIPSSITQASTILSSGDYKIVAISYQGDGSNLNTLQQLVGNNTGCVLPSSNQGDYTGAFAQSFADKIFNANRYEF
ncbi:hypothetical protein FO519_009110 [Halicephalobus sp. NKZ332]|nr:hypothetical protein FO519_009110 [Halicephalobus sp. NKZ332]